MSNRFVVLTYHRVTQEPDALRPGLCHARLFASQLAVMARFFNVLTLGDAVSRMTAGRLPRRCVCISFDDGYRDNHDVALPLLRAAGLPATFFVATGYLNGGAMWNDYVIEAVRHREAGEWDLADYGLGKVHIESTADRQALVRDLIKAFKYEPQQRRDELARGLLEGDRASTELARLMMDDVQVCALASDGMEIGAHTVTHPILTEINDEQAFAEMNDSRARLREITGQSVDMFAYPNGKPDRDYSARHAQMAKDAGFDAAFATHWGYSSAQSRLFQLPRVGFEMERGWRFGAKLARAFFEAPGPDAR